MSTENDPLYPATLLEPHYRWEMVTEYEAEFRRYRQRTAAHNALELADWNRAQAAQALVLAGHYAADPYRRAMWLRRTYLHCAGRQGEVYDGTDAVRWLQAWHEGRVAMLPCLPPGLVAMLALKCVQHRPQP